MLGQEKLKRMLANSTSKTIVLEGEKGSGKSLIAHWLAEQREAVLYAVSEMKVGNVREVREHSNSTANKTLYYFKDGDKMTNGAQNALLKVAEEPSQNTTILIAVENKETLLATILSRSSVFKMENYTREQLNSLLQEEDKWMLDIADTPGKIRALQEARSSENQYEEARSQYHIASTVIYKIGKASLQNVFTISSKVEQAYEFTDYLLMHLHTAIVEDSLHAMYVSESVSIITGARNLMHTTNANDNNVLDIMLYQLWKEHRKWIS